MPEQRGVESDNQRRADRAAWSGLQLLRRSAFATIGIIAVAYCSSPLIAFSPYPLPRKDAVFAHGNVD